MKCLKSLWEMETPRMPDQSVQAYGPLVFQNSLGISGETQAVPRRNLIPKTRSLHSADHALSVDLQHRPVRQPAGLRWTHHRVGRVRAPLALSQAGSGGCSLAHPPGCADLAASPGTSPSASPLFPVIPELWRNGSDLILQKRPGH